MEHLTAHKWGPGGDQLHRAICEWSLPSNPPLHDHREKAVRLLLRPFWFPLLTTKQFLLSRCLPACLPACRKQYLKSSGLIPSSVLGRVFFQHSEAVHLAVLGNESFHHLALLTVKLLKNEPFIGRNYLHKSEYTGMPFLSLWTSGASEIDRTA